MSCQTQTTSAMCGDRQVTSRTSAARKLSHHSHEREALVTSDKASSQKASSVPARRRVRQGASREPRREVNFAAGELEELVKTSEMVPTPSTLDQLVHSVVVPSSRMRKSSVDSDRVSTRAPTSAEPSPLMGLMVADGNATAWPSLREASSGWDFCSDASDDEELWEDLPEPALNAEDSERIAQSTKVSRPQSATWCFVPPSSTEASESKQVTTEVAKQSFAEIVRSQSDEQAHNVFFPPAPSAWMPAIRSRPVQRRAGASTQQDGDDSEQSEPDIAEAQELELRLKHHQWKKTDKVSRNYRYQCKLAQQTARRADQRRQSQNGNEMELED